MELEVGKRYVRRDGAITGQMEASSNRSFPFKDRHSRLTYTEKGEIFSADIHSSADLVSEYGETSAIPPSQRRSEAEIDVEIRTANGKPVDEPGEFLGDAEMPSGAVKFDGDKPPVAQGFTRRFPLAIQQIALVSEYGQRKYGTYDGWEALPDGFNRYDDAHGRHDTLRTIEGPYDESDSGLPHLAQRAWNAMATLELALRQKQIELTAGNDIKDGKPVLGSNGRSNDS